MDVTSDNEALTRMTTRGGQRINYAELNSSGVGTKEEPEAALFRSPLASTRGRKRKNTLEDGSVSEISHVKTVDEWMTSYENDPENALCSLLQVFISASGCKGVLTTNMLATMEYKEIIRQMTEDFDEESGDYPLIMPGPQFKKFRSNLADMLMLVIMKGKLSIIFNARVMDPIVQLLTGLADSQVRAFRHTATFSAMKIASALVDVTIELANLRERNQKQVDAETALVKASKATSEKLDALVQKKMEIKDKTKEVKEMLQYIFKSVFVHRYRDVVADIRAICVAELGNWMDVYPEHFLDDSYLKYIGWTLFDKIPDVRSKCLSALLPLYNRMEMASKLELFTNKFKDRLVSMVMDKETEVAIKACQFMTSVFRMFPGFYTLKDCVPIYEQIYANHRPLALAAGEFLNIKIFSTHMAHSASDEDMMMSLVQFFLEGEGIHDHASYLVDSLIDVNPIVKDWKTMVAMLLSDKVEGNEKALIDIMACSVKEAATGESPVGRNAARKGPVPSHPKELKNLKEERAKISEVFIPTIAQLIQKFIADKEKVEYLMSIPIYFNLEIYMERHGEKHVRELMEAVKIVMEKHADDDILAYAAEIISFFSTNTLTNQQTESFRVGLMDSLALELRKTVERFHAEKELDDEDEAEMLSAFRKYLALFTEMEMRRWEMWDTVLPVVAAISEGKHASREVLEMSISILSLSLHYELYRVTREDNPKAENVKKLKKKRDVFIHALENILTQFAACVETAFKCLADVLIIFNGFGETEHLKILQVNVSKELAVKMLTFVNDNVFCNQGEMEQCAEIDLTQKKRSLLGQFCKLILHGVIPFSDAAPLLTHYVEFFTDFGDILKLTLVKARDMDKIAYAKCIVQSLRIAYDNAKGSSGFGPEPDSEQFGQLRELAKRFAISLGTDHARNRDPLAVIHRDGILYALEGESSEREGDGDEPESAPPNISFLEMILEFSYKLLRQDKIAILRYLEKKSPKIDPDDASWQPHLLYKNSLVDRGDDASSLRSVVIGRGRGRGRPRGSVRGTPGPADI